MRKSRLNGNGEWAPNSKSRSDLHKVIIPEGEVKPLEEDPVSQSRPGEHPQKNPLSPDAPSTEDKKQRNKNKKLFDQKI